MAGPNVNGGDFPRICIIGAGPCGLTALKNVLAGGLRNVVCFDESDAIGGNWVFREDTSRMCVYESMHIISSKRLSAFEDFPMPAHYPDFPSRQEILAYFESYADAFDLRSYVELNTRVTAARAAAPTRWLVSVQGPGGAREELFDYVMVCSGHHREPFIPDHPGHFTGQVLHSCAYRRADPFRGKDVLVVGAGNSACDITADVSRVARRACISMRRAAYIVPKTIGGLAIDELYALYYRFLPKSVLAVLSRWLLPVFIGSYDRYGLHRPTGTPLDSHPTLNSSFLDGLRHGRIQPRVGIDRLDGDEVRFRDGIVERFDTIIWATGFRTSFPFLPASVVDWDAMRRPPLYLKMMHGSVPNVFFIGLFQPFGCIWNLADHQAHIAVEQIIGNLNRPRDIEKRIAREMAVLHWRYHNSPRHALEVDSHDFRRELMRELANGQSNGTSAKPRASASTASATGARSSPRPSLPA
jgi:hypothetical protein